MKEKNIDQYTKSTLPKGKTDWNRLEKMSEKEITKAAKSDAENPGWTKKMLEQAKLHMPQRKVSIHIQLDEDVIDWFKLGGKGYQTRINSVLKSYVHKH